MTKYFKRERSETRSDEFAAWGTSICYLEIGEDNYPTRQIELYENGNRLKYHKDKKFDDYGGLGDQAIDLKDYAKFEIGKEEFDLEWSKSNPKKEHQEILDLIADYLSNHPSQRFGQALFNLRVNEFINRADPSKANYSIRDIHNDQDSAIIERMLSQLAWFEEQRKNK